jgi:hypothetical protein
MTTPAASWATGVVDQVRSDGVRIFLVGTPPSDGGGVGLPAAPDGAAVLALSPALQLPLTDGLQELGGLRGASAHGELVDGDVAAEGLVENVVHGRCPLRVVKVGWGVAADDGM